MMRQRMPSPVQRSGSSSSAAVSRCGRPCADRTRRHAARGCAGGSRRHRSSRVARTITACLEVLARRSPGQDTLCMRASFARRDVRLPIVVAASILLLAHGGPRSVDAQTMGKRLPPRSAVASIAVATDGSTSAFRRSRSLNLDAEAGPLAIPSSLPGACFRTSRMRSRLTVTT